MFHSEPTMDINETREKPLLVMCPLTTQQAMLLQERRNLICERPSGQFTNKSKRCSWLTSGQIEMIKEHLVPFNQLFYSVQSINRSTNETDESIAVE
jgi:hypothetical protein